MRRFFNSNKTREDATTGVGDSAIALLHATEAAAGAGTTSTRRDSGASTASDGSDRSDGSEGSRRSGFSILVGIFCPSPPYFNLHAYCLEGRLAEVQAVFEKRDKTACEKLAQSINAAGYPALYYVVEFAKKSMANQEIAVALAVLLRAHGAAETFKTDYGLVSIAEEAGRAKLTALAAVFSPPGSSTATVGSIDLSIIDLSI